MIIFHGEHTINSRQKLMDHLSAAKQKGLDIHRYQASELNEAVLEQALGETSLFGNDKQVVIEELHSLPPSKKKDSLIAQLAATSTNSNAPQLILWEKRALTKTMLKKLGQVEEQIFSISNKVFAWLDSLNGTSRKTTLKHQLELLQAATTAEDAFYCLIMLARQIRMLIQIADGGTVGGAPFMVAKLQKQARTFTLPQLLKAHHKLLELDLAHKTSTSKLTLAQDLDLFLVHL